MNYRGITSPTGTMPVVGPVTQNMPSMEKCLFGYSVTLVSWSSWHVWKSWVKWVFWQHNMAKA